MDQHTIANTSGSLPLTRRQTNKKNKLYNTANVGLEVAANIAEGSDILAPLKAACRTTKSILEVSQAIDNNQEDWSDLIQRLKGYISALEERIALFESYPIEDRAINEAFSQPLLRYAKFLETMHDTVLDLKTKSNRSKLAFGNIKIDAAEILKINRDIEDQHRQFMEALGLFVALRVQVIDRNTKSTKEDVKATKSNIETILSDVDASAILQLPAVAFVPSSVHRTCLKGTREAVLETIRRWADDDSSEKPIFWLCDIAGSGKSTVAMSAVEAWRREGVLGGRFFFSIASSEASTTDKFCSTIARDLVHHIPELAPHVAEAVKRNPSFMRSSLEEQFQTLVSDPVHHRQGRVIIVIDALDECKSGSQRRELVEVLTTALEGCNNLKIFVTSRPDPVIQPVLGTLSIKIKLEDRLHDVSHHDNIDDIGIYVHQSLDGILSNEKRQRLVDKANGLFIWASTACRLLSDETSLSPPEIIYDHLISMDQAGDIDDIYRLIFERTNPKHYPVMHKMLALLLAAFEPLTAADLDDILKHAEIHGSAKALVRNLGSVLTEDDTTSQIRFRHPTFVEYLQRCSVTPAVGNGNKMHINIGDAHGQAASWCFKCFKSPAEGLKFNICQVESSFYLNREIPNIDTKVSTFISRNLQYASSHWLYHVAETDDQWRSTLKDELLHAVQFPYILYWMEILSFSGGVPRAIAGLRAVISHIGLEAGTRSRMSEIWRFLLTFFVPIQDSAPHIYISALPFTPTKSKIHTESAEMRTRTLTVTRGLEEMYLELPQTLEGHEALVNAIAFSPDGLQIVSGSDDKTIRLWDVSTGQQLGEPLRGHGEWIYAIAFSPDGSSIVSGSRDKTIRLWDAVTRKPLGEPLRGHGSSIKAVAFSPDGSRIVSGSDDTTIRMWDSVTGQALGGSLRGHEDGVYAVAFSPDGSSIVSGSRDKTLRIWDTVTRKPLGEPLRGHKSSINAVAFSPDGSRIVSASKDATLRLWDAVTGQSLGSPLRGHKFSIQAVAFSPDGSRIVSGSKDSTLLLWDAITGHSIGEPLRGHRLGVQTVAFSPDGSRVASGAGDWTIRLWDAVTGDSLGRPSRGEPLRGHESSINAVAFSPDGSRIVSGSEDATLRLWDSVTGQALGEPLRGHKGDVYTVAFSPDGSRIVSGSGDTTIRLWSAVTRQPLGEPFRGHELMVEAVVFSPDGARIVSVSGDKTIRLWNANTGHALGEPLRGHEGWIHAVAFSPDGSKIVSASNDTTIRLWDAFTRQQLGEPFRGHESLINAVAFSPDGSRIVSASQDTTIRLWDATTGQQVGQPLRGHGGYVNTVAFSPDGSRIMSGSSDRTLRIWDANIDEQDINSNQDQTETKGSDLDEIIEGTTLRVLYLDSSTVPFCRMAGYNLLVNVSSGCHQTIGMDYKIRVFSRLYQRRLLPVQPSLTLRISSVAPPGQTFEVTLGPPSE
ncbi:SubName: Full=Related to WD40-repeat protein (Notchless protein) {ECO:0000313/EMBL:CCA70723.1} [Serendipita indica DSM 11827]|nr:SubName: Full=Related to WD40-repeat protein (Notchless protein) {ECO:0000313/EMBL:CCA70723.1} [Serendipita indica DSM 11827]